MISINPEITVGLSAGALGFLIGSATGLFVDRLVQKSKDEETVRNDFLKTLGISLVAELGILLLNNNHLSMLMTVVPGIIFGFGAGTLLSQKMRNH